MIFGLPPAEAAAHPAEESKRSEFYFMCDDVVAEMRSLSEKGVVFSAIEEARWGSVTKIALPGGGEVGLYHPTPLSHHGLQLTVPRAPLVA